MGAGFVTNGLTGGRHDPGRLRRRHGERHFGFGRQAPPSAPASRPYIHGVEHHGASTSSGITNGASHGRFLDLVQGTRGRRREHLRRLVVDEKVTGSGDAAGSGS